MKVESALLSAVLIVVLIFSGLSLFLTYSIYRTYSNDISKLTEQYDSISENLANLTRVQPENRYVVLAWHEKIDNPIEWSEWVDVSSYEIGYLFYNTEAGSDEVTLSIGFPGVPSDVENVYPGTLYSDIDVQIGAPRKGVLKFDIQGDAAYIHIVSISIMEYDWITTSLSLYLVS